MLITAPCPECGKPITFETTKVGKRYTFTEPDTATIYLVKCFQCMKLVEVKVTRKPKP